MVRVAWAVATLTLPCFSVLASFGSRQDRRGGFKMSGEGQSRRCLYCGVSSPPPLCFVSMTIMYRGTHRQLLGLGFLLSSQEPKTYLRLSGPPGRSCHPLNYPTHPVSYFLDPVLETPRQARHVWSAREVSIDRTGEGFHGFGHCKVG